MDRFTRKTLFEYWLSPISTHLFEELVKTSQLNTYTKKLHMASFMKLLLFASLHKMDETTADEQKVLQSKQAKYS